MWVLYILFWLGVYWSQYEFSLLMINTLVYTAGHAIGFYGIAYGLNRFLVQGRYVMFFAGALAVILVASLLLALGLYLNIRLHETQYTFTFQQAFGLGFWSTLSMSLLMVSVKIIVGRVREQRLQRHQEQVRLESELQYLKAQVNPHFLFNAINSVYFLIKKDPDKAAETLIKLSDLLRFQLYDCSDERIPIEKELEYLTNFMALERIRKSNRVQVEYLCEGNLSGFEIAPFMLMPFLENAFKYVSNHADQSNLVQVTLDREGQTFKATFVNTHDNPGQAAVGGIGLKNVKRRLELLYPSRHTLDIQQTPELYSVNLTLTL